MFQRLLCALRGHRYRAEGPRYHLGDNVGLQRFTCACGSSHHRAIDLPTRLRTVILR